MQSEINGDQQGNQLDEKWSKADQSENEGNVSGDVHIRCSHPIEAGMESNGASFQQSQQSGPCCSSTGDLHIHHPKSSSFEIRVLLWIIYLLGDKKVCLSWQLFWRAQIESSQELHWSVGRIGTFTVTTIYNQPMLIYGVILQKALKF